MDSAEQIIQGSFHVDRMRDLMQDRGGALGAPHGREIRKQDGKKIFIDVFDRNDRDLVSKELVPLIKEAIFIANLFGRGILEDFLQSLFAEDRFLLKFQALEEFIEI